MRIIAVGRLREGMRLAKPIYSTNSGTRLPLLRPDAVITERVRQALMRAGVYAVYVEDALSEGIEPPEPLSPELRDRAMRDLHATFEAVATRGPSTRIPGEQVERLGEVVHAMLAELHASGGLVSPLVDLQAFDAYTLTHSLNVCVLGLMIGSEAIRRHGWTDGRGRTRHDDLDERLEKLGLGLLLHDIGKLVIPAEILMKPGMLTPDEMAIVREHPQAGLDMLERETVSPLARTAVIGHHEREDGLGYPAGKSADALHMNAQIAAIADVYDAVSSMRVYQARRPTHEAWELVASLAGSAFSPELVEVFKETVAPYPEGVAVQLSDGRRGLVTHVSRDHVTLPTVRVTHDPCGAEVSPYALDLVAERDVTILDTLPDLLGPAEPVATAPAAGPEEDEPDVAGPGELHEQRLAHVLA